MTLGIQVAKEMTGLSSNGPVADCFVAIDFETANRNQDSACAVGLVRVEHGRIARREYRLIRPPRNIFEFSWIHGITWNQVKDQPSFAELWPQYETLMEGAECLVAHNATFDRSVLVACCQSAGLSLPRLRFACTMRLARKVWGLRPTKLPDVCNFLGLPLQHHNALSDAEACAQIMLSLSQKNPPLFKPPLPS